MSQHGDWDWVHASPPCNEYSIAMTGRPRDFDTGDAISLAALRILEHYSERGACCTMENPATGFLKVRPHMRAHTNRMGTLDLCKYGARERTPSAIGHLLSGFAPPGLQLPCWRMLSTSTARFE